MKVRVGEIDLAYDETGAGFPLLLVHGFPHNRALWRPQLDRLSGSARCIAPDLRGFGESTVAPPYGMDQYADDLAGLLDSLDVDRCVLGGLSMGGYIAMAMWRRHRARIAALILADTRAEADDAGGREKRRKMMAVAMDQGMSAVADSMIEGMVGRSTREAKSPLLQELHSMMAASPPDGAVGALAAMMHRPDSSGTLPDIDVPTLIVVGDEDVLTPPKYARAMRQAIPGSRLTVIPRAGHVSNMEQPDAFNSAVLELLTSPE
jgi:3-oxoadipate enol-lactonase